MNEHKPIIGVLLALFLSSCSLAQDEAAGTSRFTFERCPDDVTLICKISLIDGKEREGGVSVKITTSTGFDIHYMTGSEKAFAGQQIRAEVHRSVAAAVKEGLPGIVAAAIKAAKVGAP